MTKKIKKIVTENPFVDELVYQTKLIALNSIVKDSVKANASETLESVTNSDMYMICYEGRASFDLFGSFPISVLYDALASNGFTKLYINRYFKDDKNKIPVEYRDSVVQSMAKYVIDTYEEKNEYYRFLIGKRPLNSTVTIPLSEFNLEKVVGHKGLYTYLHELPENDIFILRGEGLLDQIIARYPEEKYLTNLGKGITFYNARKAEHFELLYVPEVESDVIRDKYLDKYNVNRQYALSCIYSEAFKLESDYYDNFIAILISIMTMVDMLVEVQEHIVRRDIFDPRCIQFIFEQYGVPYYDEIPIKYQIRMMKNLNTLLKFKSTAKCMLDICSLFGFDSAKVFQYYILRTRKVNANNEYIFNYIKKKVPVKCEPTIDNTESVVVNKALNYVEIPFPFEDFFTKGNKMVVYLDKSIIPDTYYYVFDKKLYFFDTNILKDKSSIDFKFFYNNDDTALSQIPDHSILIKNQVVEFVGGQYTYKFNPPTDKYFAMGGKLFLIVGSLYAMGDMYDLNIENNTITFKYPDLLAAKDKTILRFMYIYSSAMELHQASASVLADQDYQTQFKIPEPIPGYCDAGCEFFITVGGTLIVEDRYHVKGQYLIFNSSQDYIKKDRNLEFHFLWNDFNNVELVYSKESVVATESMQTEFTIPMPSDNFINDGGVVFVEANGFPIPSTEYTILKNTLFITNSAYGIYKGRTIEFKFIHPKVKEAVHTVKTITATKDKQMEFVLTYPYENFRGRGNKMIVSYKDVIYEEGADFEIRDSNILEIYSISKAVEKDTNLKVDFYHFENNKDYIVVRTSHALALEEDQNVFAIEFPVYRYLETGNKFFVSVGSIFIPEDQYEIVEDKLKFKSEAVKILRNRNVSFTFIYHTIYDQLNKAVHIDTSKYELNETELNTSGALKVKIPFPFEGYLDMGNTFFISVGGYQIPLKNYDIIDNVYALIYDAKENVYDHGNTIKFSFVYTCTGFRDEIMEDIPYDTELKFVKVPLLENPDPYLKNKNNYLNYDTITQGDPTWDGDYDHSDIKNELLNRQFSYNRTKYISLTNMCSMAKLAYQQPYFLNMLFDDVMKEERLSLSLPYIDLNHKFKLNDTFTYLFALTHVFMGIDDEIPVNADKVLYVKGFNFQADLGKIAQHIKDLAKNPDDFGFLNFQIPKYQVESYNQLIKIFTQNTEIYDFVTYQMTNARNKEYYDIYKNIYDSLMIIKDTKNYYKLPNGPIASTLSEFLNVRDEYLYGSLMRMKNITSAKERQKAIIQCIQDAVYQIDEYLGTDEFKFVFYGIAGENGDYVLNYMAKVINFFKSYKCQIYDTSTQYLFDDKFNNTIRAIDKVMLTTTLGLDDDAYHLVETLDTHSVFMKKEGGLSNFKENIKRDLQHWLFADAEDTYDLTETVFDMLVHLNSKDKYTVIDALADFMSTFIKDDMYNMIDNTSCSTSLIPRDKIKLLGQIKLEVLRLQDIHKIDLAKIIDTTAKLMTDLHLVDTSDKVRETISDILISITTHDVSHFNENIDYYAKYDKILKITPLENIILEDLISVEVNRTDSYKFYYLLNKLLIFFNRSDYITVIEKTISNSSQFMIAEGSPLDYYFQDVRFNLDGKVMMCEEFTEIMTKLTPTYRVRLIERMVFNVAMSYVDKVRIYDQKSIKSTVRLIDRIIGKDKILDWDIEWFKPLSVKDTGSPSDKVSKISYIAE